MIDIAFGKAGNETSVASATFNFTNHINYIGMTTNQCNGRKGTFKLDLLTGHGEVIIKSS